MYMFRKLRGLLNLRKMVRPNTNASATTITDVPLYSGAMCYHTKCYIADLIVPELCTRTLENLCIPIGLGLVLSVAIVMGVVDIY